MTDYVKTLKPVNRHIVIVPHKNQNETESGVLLPEDFIRDEDEARYTTATVVAVATDCSPAFQRIYNDTSQEKLIVVDKSMIEDVILCDKTYHVILENYVVVVVVVVVVEIGRAHV